MDIILCDELIQEIFHHLPPPSSTTVSAVSKRWRRLLRSSLSSLSLHLSQNHHHHTSLSSFLSHHTYLTSLSISLSSTTTLTTTTTTTFSDHLLTTVSATCPNLRHLNISTGPVSLFPLLQLSTSCIHLISLAIILSRNNNIVNLKFLYSFLHLKSLTLSFIGNEPSSSLNIYNTPSTSTYKNNNLLTYQLSDDDHVFFTSTHQNNLLTYRVRAKLKLESISLCGIRPSDHAISWLWRNCSYDVVSKLVFENCEGVGDNYLFSCFVKGLVGLRELELRTCRSIVSFILHNLAENDCLDMLASLLIYDGGNKESLLRFISETRCDNLLKLDLRLPLDLDDSHLLEIGRRFDKLNVLRLHSCCMVTGEGLKTLGLALRNTLEELALTNCGVINPKDGFLVELAQYTRKIKVLDLSYNHTLLDKEFASMISSYTNLRTLKLRGCGRLTNVSLISLCKNCKHLESVDLVYCHGIRAEGIEFMILNSSKLRRLQVEDGKLSDAAKRWMADKFIEVQP